MFDKVNLQEKQKKLKILSGAALSNIDWRNELYKKF